jgi:hypothetical protein
MARTPESKTKDAIKRWLDERGHYYAMPIGSGWGRAGIPDFLVCAGGRFIGIEAKAPGKRGDTTAAQRAHIGRINAAGGIALVVDDARQLEALEQALEQTPGRP